MYEEPTRRDERDGPLSALTAPVEVARAMRHFEMKPIDSRFSNLLEQAPCQYLVLDLDGTCAQVNDAFVRLCGRPCPRG